MAIFQTVDTNYKDLWSSDFSIKYTKSEIFSNLRVVNSDGRLCTWYLGQSWIIWCTVLQSEHIVEIGVITGLVGDLIQLNTFGLIFRTLSVESCHSCSKQQLKEGKNVFLNLEDWLEVGSRLQMLWTLCQRCRRL